MHLNLTLSALLALVAGILVLVAPRLMRYILALYLIIVGLTGLLGLGHLRLP
jgi:hypothetical protein